MGCTSLPKGIGPVDEFDVNRYLGRWYEIARFDHSFERGLINVTADYSMREDGGIRVVNRGFNTDENKWEEALGKAYFVGEQHIGHLKVSFFGPFYASYVIFKLDKNNYSYSLVTGPNRDYLWVLSRTPTIDKSTYDELLVEAQNQGFDTSKLIKVKQNTSRNDAQT
jgi:apolipoprotein D and lipocalin family protein